MTTGDRNDVHPAWLPPEAFRALGARRTLVAGDGPLVETVYREVAQACASYGGGVYRPGGAADPFDLVLALASAGPLPAAAEAVVADQRRRAGTLGAEGFLLARYGDVTVVLAGQPAGLLYGLFHVVRLGESAFGVTLPPRPHRPAARLRMLDHWDNVDVHPVMGQVERGYAGGSIFWRDGARRDLTRVRDYGRLLAAVGVNAVSVNNVNVHATEARLLTDRLDDVAAIADVLRPYGIRVHLSSPSPRRSCSAACPPPTRWTSGCAPGGPGPPAGCTSASRTSAAIW